MTDEWLLRCFASKMDTWSIARQARKFGFNASEAYIYNRLARLRDKRHPTIRVVK